MININEPNYIDKNVYYTVVSQHRLSTNNNKSRWKIQLDEEVECFKKAFREKWIINYNGWGLHIIENDIKVLGESPQKEQLKIAKFIDSNHNGQWHGYPSNYRNNIQDRTSEKILKKWVETGIIQKHQMSKIRSGQKCKL